MKLIYEEKDEYVEAVKIKCTPAEYLVLNEAMRLYMENDYVHEIDRDIMRRMLEVEPVSKEAEESILDKILSEVLEYIDDIDIAVEIGDIFDKYMSESEGKK